MVMPGPVPGIPYTIGTVAHLNEMAGTSPAMTKTRGNHAVFCTFSPSSAMVRSRMMNF